MKKLTVGNLRNLRKLSLVTLCVSLGVTLPGLLLAIGLFHFTSDAFNDLLLSYTGAIATLVGMTCTVISWFIYLLSTERKSK